MDQPSDDAMLRLALRLDPRLVGILVIGHVAMVADGLDWNWIAQAYRAAPVAAGIGIEFVLWSSYFLWRCAASTRLPLGAILIGLMAAEFAFQVALYRHALTLEPGAVVAFDLSNAFGVLILGLAYAMRAWRALPHAPE